MNNIINSMLDVSNTMLITLFARACETQSINPIIKDIKAVEIINNIKKEVIGSNNRIHKMILKNKYNKKLSVTIALRSRRFDKYVMDFMNINTSGTIINFGCGLDTRFDRIDNGQVHWYDIDFPEVISLRRNYLKENSRHIFISQSILDTSWMDKIKHKGPYLILAEGVFMYLKEDEVRNLLDVVTQRFKEYELVCEVTNEYWVNKMKSKYVQWKFKRQLGISENAMFTFGIPNSQYFEKWSNKYKLIDDWTYFDDNETKMGWYNVFGKIEILRKVQWIVHYKMSD